jgi:hypothetical protein
LFMGEHLAAAPADLASAPGLGKMQRFQRKQV